MEVAEPVGMGGLAEDDGKVAPPDFTRQIGNQHVIGFRLGLIGDLAEEAH